MLHSISRCPLGLESIAWGTVRFMTERNPDATIFSIERTTIVLLSSMMAKLLVRQGTGSTACSETFSFLGVDTTSFRQLACFALGRSIRHRWTTARLADLFEV